MLELIEGLKIDVDTVLNLPKWLRSTIEKARFKPLSENITLKQNQTLEGLTRDIGDSNWRENWFNLAINNNLQEEDYTSEGGNLLSVTLVTGQVLQLDSVVDTINEDTILGKDLDKKLSFEDNDLKVLNSKDTFYQSVLIASSLRKGQNSSLPELGLPREVFGINKNILNYPSIIRRITESMKTDDTIKTINIEDISLEQDGVKITLGVNSILDDFKIQRSLFI
jgi:hypothetical protein